MIAVDAGTGIEVWTFDPEVDFSERYSEMFASRGVSAWRGPTAAGGPCRVRILLGTFDARLIALDADTGTPCADFGDAGTVNLATGIRPY